jgi:hypothetical protein
MTSRVLPPGQTLPPLITADAGKGPSTHPPGRKDGKRSPRRSQRHPGRFAAINAFVDASMSTLPRASALVWVALWRFERDGVTRIAVAALARLVGCCKRQAIRAIARLVDDGLVEVVYQGGKDAGVSVYRVTPVSPAPVTFRARSR